MKNNRQKYSGIFSRYKNNSNYQHNKIENIRINNILNLIYKKNNIVLDLGSWDGYISEKIKKKGNIVYGVDNSKEALIKAKNKGIITKLVNLGVNNLPFTSEYFDYVIAGEIIEHIYHTNFFLSEIHRVLKDKGKLIITTPNLASLGRRILLLGGKNPAIETSENEKNAGHVRYYVLESIKELLKVNRFKITEYCSDVVNFDNKGKFYNEYLARIFPQIGRTIILLCQKNFS